MDSTEPTAASSAVGQGGTREADPKVLLTSKPLHRFVQREPKSLGIVLAILGCAEILMGFNLVTERFHTSSGIYIPFWQGILFVVCGSLSIYTEISPSKKMVTVSMAMYVVSTLGIVVSIGYRIYCLAEISYRRYRSYYSDEPDWKWQQMSQLLVVESLLFMYSLCVGVILIFLSAVARLALKSTQTQVIVQCIPTTARSEATTN